MIRAVLYLFLAIVLITLLRSVIGIVSKALSAALEPDRAGEKRSAAGAGGELKRDPVCGVFVSESASVKKAVGGETLHFCSAACRDRYVKNV